MRWARRHPYLIGSFLYVAFAAVVFRDGGLGSTSSLPQGGNALNTWLVFAFYQRHPFAMWLFPFTDWGQPYGGFTGPTLLTPAMVLVPPTILVRSVEIVAFVGSGLGMMWALRRVGSTPMGGFVAGFYYMTLAQTSQIFEGHVPSMISLALGPPFLIVLWQLLRRPGPRDAVLAALLLYLLISLGDLGILYFYVFFAALLAGYTIVRRVWARRYSLGELAAVLGGIVLVIALSISWLYPFAVGVRPEYTTNITVQILPFRLTAPVNIVYGYSGFVQDEAFIHFTYGQFAYGPWGSNFLPFALLIPIAISAYAFLGRRPDRIAFFASGVLAIVFATGDLYPGLSQFNEFVYHHVPYFDSVPSLMRWVEYSILVYGFLLGRLISDIERDAVEGFPRLTSLWESTRISLHLPRASRASVGAGVPGPLRGRRGRTLALGGFALAVVLLVLVQNVALVTEPPSTFNFPGEYTASLGFLEHQAVSGEVLAVPFGAIYERTPWGGVSGSSAYITPYYTNADTAIFEAGTPYSLAIDSFVSNGITYGGSRNMSKFLGSANVQFIVATRYPNWNYSSSAISPSSLSYEALDNETGLGPATNVSSIQTVYSQQNWAGNLSFHPSYLLYFTADSTLYSILDSQWYPGPAMALVNGSSVGPALPTFIEHASGIVVSPRSVQALGTSTIALARAAHVPVIEVISPADFSGKGLEVRPDAWNATGGQDLQFDRSNASAQIDLAANLLAAAGYTNLSLSGQVAAPPGSNLTIDVENTSTTRAGLGTSVVSAIPVNYSSAGYVQAGEDNRTVNSSLFLNITSRGGATFLNWTPAPNATDFQYLQFGVRNLSGANGFSLDVSGPDDLPLEGRIGIGNTIFELPGYATNVPTGPNTFQYRFLFPSGGFGMPASLRNHLDNLSLIQIGLQAPGFSGSLTLSNLTILHVSTPRLSPANFGTISATSETMNISMAPTGRLGFLELSTGAYPQAKPFDRDVQPQPAPTDMSITSVTNGWGIITLAQTYSPFWNLAGPTASSAAVVDVGLSGWLVNTSMGTTWQATYMGDGLESTALMLEAIAVPAIAIPLAVSCWRPELLSRRKRGGVR